MVKLFRLSEPITLLILCLYTVLINFNLYIDTPAITLTSTAPFSQFFYWLTVDQLALHPHILTTIFIVFLAAQAVAFNQILEYHDLLQKKGCLGGFSYLLVMSLFNHYIWLTPAFLANFVLLILLYKSFSSYTNNDFSNIFDMGFAVGIASLFYLPTLLLSIFVFLVLTVTRIFNWKEWALCACSIFIPYFLVGTGYFAINQLSFLFTQQLEPTSAYWLLEGVNWIEIGVKIILVLFLTLMGLYFIQLDFLKKAVKIRKFLIVVLYLLIASIVILALERTFFWQSMALLAIPLAILLSYSFSKIERNRIAEPIHLTILTTIILFWFL